MKNDYYYFIKSHNLVNRVYDMLIFFKIVKSTKNEKGIKQFLKKKLMDVEYTETLAKIFEKKLRKHKNNVELRCNINDLIYDLEYLKQYLF